MEGITHYDLCRLTAERFFKTLRADVALWEYKAMVFNEEPDVLIFKGGFTSLYEIKVSRSDFKADAKKDCRVKYRVPSYYYKAMLGKLKFDVKTSTGFSGNVEQYYTEAPHLGSKRYFVCPAGLIDTKEVPENWGLIWFKNGRFSHKKPSGTHKKNIHGEMKLLTHAFRKRTGLVDCNVIVNSFEDRG